MLGVLLIAHSHNAFELFRFCLNFLSLNEETILQSKEFSIFKKCIEPDLFAEIKAELQVFRNEFFVQHSIERFIRENSRIAKVKIEPDVQLQSTLLINRNNGRQVNMNE